MPDSELLMEVDFHQRVERSLAVMRGDTESVVEGFRLDFDEGKRNRFADDAGPDQPRGLDGALSRSAPQ